MIVVSTHEFESVEATPGGFNQVPLFRQLSAQNIAIRRIIVHHEQTSGMNTGDRRRVRSSGGIARRVFKAASEIFSSARNSIDICTGEFRCSLLDNGQG